MKGATDPGGHDVHRLCVSIPAPVKGATRPPGHPAALQGVSIPAPVKGATVPLSGIRVFSQSFNSCPREGGNLGLTFALLLQYVVSIPAPVKGATRAPGRKQRREGVSIPAPVKGATAKLSSMS